MISGYVLGDREVIARLKNMPDKVMDAVAAKVDELGISLQRRVVTGFLSGPRPTHLGRVTGRLAASISRGGADTTSHFERSGTTATAYVGTNVPYGAIWENRGLPARTIVPVHAKALRFTIGGEVIFRKSVNMPAKAARPFLAPALEEMKPLIISELQKVVTQAAVEAME